MQELRRAIKTLKEDSKRKLNNDAEVHGAVEQLFRQVDSLRDGLATLSDAMMQEVASRNKHFSQVLNFSIFIFVEPLLIDSVQPVREWRCPAAGGQAADNLR